MKLKVHLSRAEDLLEEDASLSLGWLSIKERAMEVSFFQEGLCMVFLTLTSLLEILKELETKKNVKEKKWIGEDNGELLLLLLKGEDLSLSINDLTVFYPFKKFKDSVIASIDIFLSECTSKNPLIVEESAYEDLISIYSKLVD